MIAYLLSFAAAAAVWTWFWRQSGRPDWGRVKRPWAAQLAIQLRAALKPFEQTVQRQARAFAEAGRMIARALPTADEFAKRLHLLSGTGASVASMQAPDSRSRRDTPPEGVGFSHPV